MNYNKEIIYHPIGVIKSQFKTIEDTPKHGEENDIKGKIEINPKFIEAMADIKVGEKI